MNELIQGISVPAIEEITGESPKVIKQWKKGTRKIPESAIRLLRLYLNGDASAILGKDWEGHIFKDNLLYIPEWKRGLSPHEIRSLFWECQLNRCLKNENRLLKQEIERRNEEIDKLEVKAAFYKKQLVLESRFGWILEKSFL
ncbi:hypothetical protein SAMN05421690_10853 [Nitrosomonas sp. Nm51]|uniref:hypothetical protein n=1 Tax=Nitrosomonas sp. Nm51 TaxID=133720 RepID=UPI0008BEEB6A|nr:hypothetical protein [Nitrosomonas sp. Nm51]SER81158.1 hypothetical protein SAMN05421690_10853 [Nitrosomonas sp. Nm51]